jgi:hypothetical protein
LRRSAPWHAARRAKKPRAGLEGFSLHADTHTHANDRQSLERPPWQRSGRVLLTVVALFGVITVAFGLSTSFPLSLLLLFLAGAVDNVSVVIRITLEQMATPNALRGRVSAVHYIFIGISNGLGELESGVAAGLLGTVPAVVLGGLATLGVVALVAFAFPSLRNLGSLTTVRPDDVPA